MSTQTMNITPAEALRLLQALRPCADQNRWQRAVAGVSSLSLKVYGAWPVFQVVEGRSAQTVTLYDGRRFTCSCKEFTDRLQAKGVPCRHVIGAALVALLPPALDGARARQATDWIGYLTGLQTQITEAQAAATEAAERAAIQAEAQGDGKSPDRPAAPPTHPDSAFDADPKAPPLATGPGTCEPSSPPAPAANTPTNPRGGPTPHMVLKRSLSPDGRIDSLSIEIDFAVTDTSREQLQAKALKLIALQEGIARQYLERYRAAATPSVTNGSPAPPNGAGTTADTGKPQPAKLVEIGQTKTGKLYASFELKRGQWAKLFGREKALAKELAVLGVNGHQIRPGTRLSIPCLVLTQRQGEYINIDRVFPYTQ